LIYLFRFCKRSSLFLHGNTFGGGLYILPYQKIKFMAKNLPYKYKFDKDLLATRLKEVIKESGLTRGQIKLRTGFSKRSQREMESGRANITDDTRLDYLKALGISLFYFFNDKRFDYKINANKIDTEVIPSGGGEEE